MATRWRAYLGDEMNQPAGEVRLAPLSATRNQRVGMTRGAEGLRAKQFRSTIVELITNLAIIVVIGTIAWLLVALLIHPMLFARAVIRTFSVGALLGGAGPADGGWTWSRLLHFGVGSELSRDATIGLLAVVLTGAVAVAVASPRESSIMAWSQDRAWQVFVVAVGHIASVAALVLALSRMPSWRGAAPEARPEIAAGLVFALLCAASAASMSAMQSRLDEWQQRRRLLLAEARLRRAHVRLGPSPRPTRLVLAGIGCFGLCFGWTFVPAALLTVGLVLDPSAGYTAGDAAVELVTYTVLNVVPMAAIGVLFTVRWVSAWGLSGRVAVTVAALSAVVVVLMLVPLGVVTSYLVEEPAGDDSSVAKTVVVIVFAVALSLPAALFTVFLVVARVNAFRTHAATGPATFVLHIALRLGWRNFQKQRDELDLSRESG